MNHILIGLFPNTMSQKSKQTWRHSHNKQRWCYFKTWFSAFSRMGCDVATLSATKTILFLFLTGCHCYSGDALYNFYWPSKICCNFLPCPSSARTLATPWRTTPPCQKDNNSLKISQTENYFVYNLTQLEPQNYSVNEWFCHYLRLENFERSSYDYFWLMLRPNIHILAWKIS